MAPLYLTLLLSLLPFTFASRFELADGKLADFPKDDQIVAAIDSNRTDKPVGKVSPRDLFGRQYCSTPGANIICGAGCCFNYKLCCERSDCFDPIYDKCCSGGGSCPRLGSCCQDDKCCRAGTYCIRDTSNNQISCRSSGVAAATPTFSLSSLTFSFSSISARITTAPTTTARASTFSCFDDGYTACANSLFCCPSSAYCFYNTLSQPRCYSTSYYYYTYTYSWSYSFGVRYFRTTTSYYLGGLSVPQLTTPPLPTTAPPTALSINTGGSSIASSTGSASLGTLTSGTLLGGAASETGDSGASTATSTAPSSAASQTVATATTTVGGSNVAPGRMVAMDWWAEAMVAVAAGVLGVAVWA
ncbi:MAG: hypothetical protein M1814_004566 [Vezdaea aestivalis]|nr:MAG: hypothetical protein M1814_004566 [Vezdaea aestivalis]